jgi:hypothetical protein
MFSVAATFAHAPRLAEMIDVSKRTTGLVVILNDALLCPAPTITVAGTWAARPVLPRFTTSPPTRAADVSVTVPSRELPPTIDPTERTSDPTQGAGTAAGLTVSVADALLDADAVIVAVVEAETVDVETGNNAELCPAATVMEDGTPAAELLLDRLTCIPPAGAGAAIVTVPVAPWPPVTEEGEIERPRIVPD